MFSIELNSKRLTLELVSNLRAAAAGFGTNAGLTTVALQEHKSPFGFKGGCVKSGGNCLTIYRGFVNAPKLTLGSSYGRTTSPLFGLASLQTKVASTCFWKVFEINKILRKQLKTHR